MNNLLPILGSPGGTGLASCHDCRATVIAIPPEEAVDGYLLIDPGSVERDWLRQVFPGMLPRFRFRSLEDSIRGHVCLFEDPDSLERSGPLCLRSGRRRASRAQAGEDARLARLESLLNDRRTPYRVGASGRTIRLGDRVASAAGGGWRVGWRYGAGFDQCDTAEQAADELAGDGTGKGGELGCKKA